MSRYYVVCVLLVMILCSGCSDNGKLEEMQNSTENKPYWEWVVEVKECQIEEFDNVVLGTTLLSELYTMVGETQYSMMVGDNVVEVYPLIDGRYISVICVANYEGDDVDFTITELKITDENPWQILKEKKFKIEDFDNVIVGKTTYEELYDKVGTTLHYITLNTKTIAVYPLEDGRFLSVIYWYPITDEGILDYTIDEMTITEEAPMGYRE